ncbi:hypothetical protein [Pseudomonas koreensis]|uniref:hypothetical protein n=1 Tax=Pseudomonas koreensis TaxID=198620 RepID=UPI001B33B333|nr:hypothetical protein [Pseudomonas koreensis]MBP4001502.1 hypothetical protein [Pseudomonas koreensis]
MFSKYPNQKLGRRLFFSLWILMLVVAVVAIFVSDWMSAILILLVSSVFFIPALILSEEAFTRLVSALAKLSFLAPLVRFLGG